MGQKRNRSVFSIKKELLSKSKEAILSAIQLFNNPLVKFKTENFIVLAVIAWTYLMHAYFKSINVEYRIATKKGVKNKYEVTEKKNFKHLGLMQCINKLECPIKDNLVKQNLKFLIGLRNEIEHQMTSNIDEAVIDKIFACCINYNNTIKEIFGNEEGVENFLSFSLQFSSLQTVQLTKQEKGKPLLTNLVKYVSDFESQMTSEEKESAAYSMKIHISRTITNSAKKADVNLTQGKDEALLQNSAQPPTVFIDDRERAKHKPKYVVEKMISLGYKDFTMNTHTRLWKKENAKDLAKGFGTLVADKDWYWYESWVIFVTEYCLQNYSK